VKITVSRGFDEAERKRAAILFWQAFSSKLTKLMGPDDKGCAFFELALNPDFALVARDDAGNMLGLAGFKTQDGGLAEGDLKTLAKIYGWFGAVWRGLFLNTLERMVQPGVYQMDGIFVASEARGQGVGTALLLAIKSEARRTGAREIQLDVIDTNPRARALYEREGFCAVGEEQTGVLRYLFSFDRATRMRWPVDDVPA